MLMACNYDRGHITVLTSPDLNTQIHLDFKGLAVDMSAAWPTPMLHGTHFQLREKVCVAIAPKHGTTWLPHLVMNVCSNCHSQTHAHVCFAGAAATATAACDWEQRVVKAFACTVQWSSARSWAQASRYGTIARGDATKSFQCGRSDHILQQR